MITDVEILGADIFPVAKLLDTVLDVERVSVVVGKGDGKDMVVYHVRRADERMFLVYSYAACAVRSAGLVNDLCPCVIQFHKAEGYYTMQVTLNPLA